ncbi:MAG: hypothetical protein EBZ67_02435 [Chitinophagia bacterium]|nr:hypothetical protein [Chitinophagia bacterium]
MLSLIIGTSIDSFGILYNVLVVVSFFAILYLYYFRKSPQKNHSFRIPFISAILIHILIFITGANYADGIPLFILAIGTFIISTGIYCEREGYILFGLFLIGLSALFRQHYVLMVLMLGFYLLFHEKRFWRILLLFSPLSGFFLIYIIGDFEANWQKLNFYRFIYGVKWNEIDVLLESKSFVDFSMSSNYRSEYILVFKKIIIEVWRLLKSHVIPMALIVLLFYRLFPKKKFIFLSALLFLYTMMILPGWVRGIYPIFILLLFLLIFFFNQYDNNSKKFNRVVFVLLFAVFATNFYSFIRLSQELLKRTHSIENELMPVLREEIGIDKKDKKIFTDDAYLFFASDHYEVDNFRGWSNLHKSFNFSRIRKEFEQSNFSKYDVYILLKNGYFVNKYNIKHYQSRRVADWVVYYK